MRGHGVKGLRVRRPGVLPKTPGRSSSAHGGKTNYKIVAVSLYNRQAESLELAAASLKQAGYLNVGRSFLVQTLIERVLEDKSPQEIVQFFEERRLRRPLALARARRQGSLQQRGKAAPTSS